MARYGCTITVDAGNIPSSQSNFAWLATDDNFPTAAIDGGSTSILNGGGNLRCYTDDTKATQLPIEVVTFVTGGTPDVKVWGLSGTLAVGSTVYIEADTVATTQPAVTDTYGRNSVWANRAVEQHFTTSNPVDSTGNHTTSSNGSPTSNGESITFNGSSQYLSVADASDIDGGSAFTLIADYDPTVSGNQYLFWKRGVAGGYALTHIKTTNQVRFTLFGISDYDIAAAFSARSLVHAVIDGTNYELFIDGVSKGSTTISSTRNTNTNDLRIASRTDSSGVIDGHSPQTQWNSSFVGSALSDDYITAEANNITDTATFWTTSAWEDQDAGGSASIPVIMNQLRNQGIN